MCMYVYIILAFQSLFLHEIRYVFIYNVNIYTKYMYITYKYSYIDDLYVYDEKILIFRREFEPPALSASALSPRKQAYSPLLPPGIVAPAPLILVSV